MDKLIKNKTIHLCVDMQRIFSEPTDWQNSWIKKVLPQIFALTECAPSQTIFTRFIPARKPGEGQGMWKKYYKRWGCMTIEEVGEDMLALIPELSQFSPPAEIIDKHVYGPWIETDLHPRLQRREVNTLIISGGETDICVLATILGAIDFGYRIILASDALCSSQDSTHDSMMNIYHNRYSVQLEVHQTDYILSHWER